LIAAHTHYPDFANPELLDKIPLAAATVLDVGCAQGALGEAYLRRNPNVRMLGIDIDPESVEHAARRMTEVICGDVEANPMPFSVPEGIDCIVYGDVLEHLRDPWGLLAAHAEYLKPDGTVLVCMPNVEHWLFALKLLNGTFDYEEQGLLDRTHLRWFTPRTMAKALVDAGLQLSDVAPRPINAEQAEQFTTALAPGLRAIGVDPADYLNRCGTLQYIWRARKAAPPRLMISLTMLAPQGGVSDVRVIEPLRALRTDSSIYAALQPEPEITAVIADAPRIAVLHRPLLMGEAGLARIRTLIEKDYVIVSEFDDHPMFIEERGLPLDQLLTFKAVHAIQTSTPALQDLLRLENPEIAMFRNGIFELPPVSNFADPEKLTMIFGALNRGEDWAPLMEVLNEVARAVGERLNFQVVHDQEFFDALDTPNKNFTPMCGYAQYLKLLGASDIAFMPLADNAFNRAKSDLKFIEAGSCRVAALASDVVYADSVADGKTGLLFRNPMELRSALFRLLAYPEAARRMGEAARNYVAKERMLAYQVAARTSWYRSLWERRDALNAALKARVPALFS
jgi:2-polyprenyl-3-methyl-5-hydroxy-6-metoxy-1,4-benzoquinol methylase